MHWDSTSHRSNSLTLLAFVVAMGLLTVPAECTVAMGPHSLFTDARDVATLQKIVAGDEATGHHGEQPTVATMAQTSVAPIPAGSVSGAIASIELPRSDIVIHPPEVGASRSPHERHIVDQCRIGPEPPPPRTISR
jgi:hypothetical protein